MNLISKNIRYLRKQKGKTQETFSKDLGIKRSQLGSYEEGRANPNYETLLKVSEMFDISVDDILTTDLSDQKSKRKDVSGKNLRVLAITTNKNEKENIELVPEKAAAGYTKGYSDPEYINELPKFNIPFLPQGTYRAFEITGDSMLPLEPGSIVVGAYVENWQQIKDGQTYIIISKNEGIVYKRVYNKIKSDGTLVLRSDNSVYAPYNMPVEEILEVWKATLQIQKINDNSDVSIDQLVNIVKDLRSEVDKLKSKS
ncbi:MAG: LexA family transcriptional regulator [Bacteroidia bacterium]|nr:LexA family transcriptional regulator [Bacteroidia bacterium]